MENIEEKILQFSELSAEEQQAVETFVVEHPEWYAFLEEVKALEALRHKARLLHEVNDEALAYYVVARQYEVGSSAPLQRVFARVEERLSYDAALRARYEALVQRLDEIASALDPVTQFEELTGFCLPAADGDTADSERAGRGAARRIDRSVNGGSAEPFIRWRAVQWAAAAVVFLGVLYGGLFAVSEATQSEAEHLALVDLSETEIEGYALNTRGGEATTARTSTDAIYLQALQSLHDARITTLGLFPRYDEAKLARAEDLLQRVIEREETRSFLQIEAYFFLGKVHLAQGNIEAARSNFQTIAICDSRRTPEAVEILSELNETYPLREESSVVGWQARAPR